MGYTRPRTTLAGRANASRVQAVESLNVAREHRDAKAEFGLPEGIAKRLSPVHVHHHRSIELI